MVSHADILGVFLELPAADLQAVELVKLHRPSPGNLYPDVKAIPQGAVIAATIELMEYTRRCSAVIAKVCDLPAHPLQTVSILEYSI